MQCKVDSFMEMGTFEEADLLPGHKTIGLKWCYDIKVDECGKCIPGKEKAHLVAQGFSQCPKDYNKTYVLVEKMSSIWAIFAWAATHSYKIFQFNCKTAFLHTKNRKDIYSCQIPPLPIA